MGSGVGELECGHPRHRPVLRELGTGGRKHNPTPRGDLLRGTLERSISGHLRVPTAEVPGQVLVIPTSSDTALLCNLGHITCAHGDTAATWAAEPSGEKIDNLRQIWL